MDIKLFRQTIVFLCICTCTNSQPNDSWKLPIEVQIVDYTARPVDHADHENGRAETFHIRNQCFDATQCFYRHQKRRSGFGLGRFEQ